MSAESVAEDKLKHIMAEYSDFFSSNRPPDTPYKLNDFITVVDFNLLINRLFVDIFDSTKTALFRRHKFSLLKQVREAYKEYNKAT